MSISVPNSAGATPRWLDDGVAAEILAIIDDAGEPVGARHVRAELSARGHDLSESTMARRLRDLDARRLTEPVGSKGRRLTPAGAERVADLRRSTSGARLVAATEIETADDVLNLLRARRAIEPEAVRDATVHATPGDLDDLRRIIAEHQRRLRARDSLPRDCALSFHREAGKLVRNPLVGEMLRLVLDERLDHVEAALDVILETHHHDGLSVGEHGDIVEAMAAGDGSRASELMRNHLNRLLGEVEEFLGRYDPALVNRLLKQI